MFSHRRHPKEKRTSSAEKDSGPYLFGPFPRQTHIRAQTRNSSSNSTSRSLSLQGGVAAHGSAARGGNDEGPHPQPCDGVAAGNSDIQSEQFTVTTTSLPSEQELRESGRPATARLVQLLSRENAGLEEEEEDPKKAATEEEEDPLKQFRGGIPWLYDQVYANDVVHRKLSVKDVLGHLPQTAPTPFSWKADEASTVVPRSRVITMGYQIQFPVSRKKVNSANNLIAQGLAGRLENLFMLELSQLQDPATSVNAREGSKPAAVGRSIPFAAVPEKCRTSLKDAGGMPQLKHTHSESLRTPWWVAREYRLREDRRSYLPSVDPSRFPELSVKHWNPHMVYGLSAAANIQKMPLNPREAAN